MALDTFDERRLRQLAVYSLIAGSQGIAPPANHEIETLARVCLSQIPLRLAPIHPTFLTDKLAGSSPPLVE
jgi:hypothetical protein